VDTNHIKNDHYQLSHKKNKNFFVDKIVFVNSVSYFRRRLKVNFT